MLAERIRVLRDDHFAEIARRRLEIARAIIAARESGLSWRHLEELTGIRHQTLRNFVNH